MNNKALGYGDDNKGSESYFFANTLWFLVCFKRPHIRHCLTTGKVVCIYLKDGPPYNRASVTQMEREGVRFVKLEMSEVLRLRNIVCKGSGKNSNENRIFVYTLSCYVLTILLLPERLDKVIYTLEGMGRLFSSDSARLRLIRRVVEVVYRFTLPRLRGVKVINYKDAEWLSQKGIVSIAMIGYFPGTGLNNDVVVEGRCGKYIDFISRILPEKGFYTFVYGIREAQARYGRIIRSKGIIGARVVAPASDVSELTDAELKELERINIRVETYKPDIREVLKSTALLVLPTKYAEGLSRIGLEAVANRIPIVLSVNRGTEGILDSKYEYYLDSCSPAEVASSIYRLINDERYYPCLPYEFAESVMARYSEEESVKSFFEGI